MLEGEWREAISPWGKLFFYHTSRHEVRWDPPPEGLYERRRNALVVYFKEVEAKKVKELAKRLGTSAPK
jgi:hypothetical protein